MSNCKHVKTHNYKGYKTCLNCGDLVSEPQRKDSRRVNVKMRLTFSQYIVKKHYKSVK